MKLKAFAKLNLNLRVKKKFKNGLHNIETIAILLNLNDELVITKTNNYKDDIIFQGKFKNHVNIKNNTVIKTLNLLRKLGSIKNRYKIIINKNIPAFAGLGGGTANSFFLVKYFIKKIPSQIIKKFEKEIGSDFKIFLSPLSFQKNLSKIKKFKKKLNLNVVLIYPNVICSTKDIYSRVRTFSKPSNININSFKKKSYLIKVLQKEKNDLQKIVEKKYPKIKQLLNFISNQHNCIFSRMTGSGSVCFGLFRTEKSAKLATIKAKKRFPKYWCVTTKSI